MDDLKQILCDIQDFLAPQLDGWEQMLYHYIFRHTYLDGRKTIVIPARSIGSKLGIGRTGASELSRNSIPRKLRSLEQKGAIKIIGKSTSGTEIELILPRTIHGLICDNDEPQPVDLNSVDFFSSPENRQRILTRDEYQCRYCLRSVDLSNFTIDHIVPQADGGGNNFQNLVSACFECNSRKHSQSAEEFLRNNYRANLLTTEEHDVCLTYIRSILSGEIVPK